MINKLMKKMIAYYAGDPKRIQHFMKVYEFARLIGGEEKLDDKSQYILEISALVHDIGIKAAEEKYGSSSGKLQEKEGPFIARSMLTDLKCENDVIERVCYLVGHHHTYDDIQGMDYQILVEADFLVNLYEDAIPADAIRSVGNKVFRTETGKQILKEMYGLTN